MESDIPLSIGISIGIGIDTHRSCLASDQLKILTRSNRRSKVQEPSMIVLSSPSSDQWHRFDFAEKKETSCIELLDPGASSIELSRSVDFGPVKHTW